LTVVRHVPARAAIDMQGADAVVAHLVRDDPERGHLGLGELGGEGRGHGAAGSKVPAPFDAGLAVRRPLRPSSRGPWCVLASGGWVLARVCALRAWMASAAVWAAPSSSTPAAWARQRGITAKAPARGGQPPGLRGSITSRRLDTDCPVSGRRGATGQHIVGTVKGSFAARQPPGAI